MRRISSAARAGGVVEQIVGNALKIADSFFSPAKLHHRRDRLPSLRLLRRATTSS
jgi:hypothetical protein